MYILLGLFMVVMMVTDGWVFVHMKISPECAFPVKYDNLVEPEPVIFDTCAKYIIHINSLPFKVKPSQRGITSMPQGVLGFFFNLKY